MERSSTLGPPARAGRVRSDRAARRLLDRIADRIERTPGDEVLTGTVLDPVEAIFEVGELGPGLYQGLAGVAVTYAAAGELLGDERYRDVAAATTARLAEAVSDGALQRANIGLEGIGGVLWAATSLLREAGERDSEAEAATELLKESAEALLTALRGQTQAWHLDLTGGEAGALSAVLTTIEADFVGGDILAAGGRRLADLLIAAAESTERGVVWPQWEERSWIVGLGHGSAGIALSLQRAADILDHRTAEVRALVDAAAAQEDALLDRATGNWLDTREEAALLDEHRSAWCYGAAGVRLVRHRLGRSVPDGCAPATAIDAFAVDHLCCGSAGRLVVAAEEDDPSADQLAGELADRVLAGSTRVAALEGPGSSTGLFVGELGVAWALLHHANGRSGADLLLLS